MTEALTNMLSSVSLRDQRFNVQRSKVWLCVLKGERSEKVGAGFVPARATALAGEDKSRPYTDPEDETIDQRPAARSQQPGAQHLQP